MKHAINLLFTACILLACSPTEQTPKIAENQREVLNQTEEAANAIEQSAAKMQQDIDEQSY